MYGTIVLIAKRTMSPTSNCSTGMDRIVMCGLVRTTVFLYISVCVYACVRACVSIYMCMCVNGGFWRASKWGGGFVCLKRCADMALESPEVGFIKTFYGFFFQW